MVLDRILSPNRAVTVVHVGRLTAVAVSARQDRRGDDGDPVDGPRRWHYWRSIGMNGLDRQAVLH